MKIRSFICIDLPDEIIKEVARVQSLLEKQKFTGKLTELENLHLTLKFLGEIDEIKLNQVKERLSKIKFQPLSLKLDKAGNFNYKGSPKIVWIKIAGDAFNFQKQVDESLENLFPKEERFMSHLTVARIKHVKDKKGFIEYINDLNPKKLEFTIDRFKLKSSELRTLGPVYKTIEEYPV